jgi:nitrite reductase [NAD(P)H] large subunit
MSRKRLAIIGSGMATARLLDELVRRDALALYEVSVFGEEPHGCYNRILLNRVLAGGEAGEISLKPPEWFAERGVRFHRGVAVTSLDTPYRHLFTDEYEKHPYDVAVFATGSAPIVPEVGGLKLPDGKLNGGAFLFRTIRDCERIRDHARPAGNAIVVGGGLLGLEAAKGLCDLGQHVTVVHRSETLMNAQLDPFGGRMLRRAIEDLGIFVRTHCEVKAVLGEQRVEGVELADGARLASDLVVFACGIRPRIDVAQLSGIPTKAGILVNDSVATRVPGVYAVGECAEHDGRVYGIVQPIWEQCAVLADVLTGARPQARYRGSKLYTRLKVAGVEVASMGTVDAQLDSDEVIQVIEERKTIYRKLIVRDGRLIGAMLVGNSDTAASLIRMYERGDPLPANRLDVFASPEREVHGAAGAWGAVCSCHGVGEETLRAAIRGGCRTLADLMVKTKAGSGCGSCRGQLASLILEHGRAADKDDNIPLGVVS